MFKHYKLCLIGGRGVNYIWQGVMVFKHQQHLAGGHGV